jgi:hypothetical protein
VVSYKMAIDRRSPMGAGPVVNTNIPVHATVPNGSRRSGELNMTIHATVPKGGRVCHVIQHGWLYMQRSPMGAVAVHRYGSHWGPPMNRCFSISA